MSEKDKENDNNPLKKVSIFSKLNEEEMDYILNSMTIKTYHASEVIFYEGDVPDGLYVVNRGRVKISLMDESSREITLSILREGSFFGEMALFDDSPRSATVQTMEETEFFILTKSYFLKLIEQSPIIAKNILKEMSTRLREADHQIRNLALFDVAGRLANILIYYFLGSGSYSESGNESKSRN